MSSKSNKSSKSNNTIILRDQLGQKVSVNDFIVCESKTFHRIVIGQIVKLFKTRAEVKYIKSSLPHSCTSIINELTEIVYLNNSIKLNNFVDFSIRTFTNNVKWDVEYIPLPWNKKSKHVIVTVEAKSKENAIAKVINQHELNGTKVGITWAQLSEEYN